MNAFFILFLQAVQIVINLYIWIIIISALLSWIRPNPYNPIVRILYSLTEPVYNTVRKVIPTTFGMMDIAPMIVIFILMIINRLLLYAF